MSGLKRGLLVATVCAAVMVVTTRIAGAAPVAPRDANERLGHDKRCKPIWFDERIAVGFAITPVPLDLEGKSVGLVGLGSYLVNAVGACNDCHTRPPHKPGGDPFKGEPEQINTEHYLAGGTPFGSVVSTNITPDPETGLPAGYTFGQFESLMRTGRSPRDGHILQVMPWPVYGKMTTCDLRAIYEYLRAIPHATPPEP